MSIVLIGVGSNLGEREKHIRHARDFLTSIRGVRFLATSSIRETDPVGGPPQGKYLNAVWQIETELSPDQLLTHLLEIEKQLGRERQGRNFQRTVDLDILFYGQKIINKPNLIVPHPRLQERLFVLEPMVELMPDWVHPVLKKTMKELLKAISVKR